MIPLKSHKRHERSLFLLKKRVMEKLHQVYKSETRSQVNKLSARSNRSPTGAITLHHLIHENDFSPLMKIPRWIAECAKWITAEVLQRPQTSLPGCFVRDLRPIISKSQHHKHVGELVYHVRFRSIGDGLNVSYYLIEAVESTEVRETDGWGSSWRSWRAFRKLLSIRFF